jgi:hypothetical protein
MTISAGVMVIAVRRRHLLELRRRFNTPPSCKQASFQRRAASSTALLGLIWKELSAKLGFCFINQFTVSSQIRYPHDCIFELVNPRKFAM